MKVLTATEMYAYEQKVMQEKGVPNIVLMEAAARAVVKQMQKKIRQTDRILVVFATGNNGGDGLAVARILHNEGYQVTALVLGEREKASEQNKIQYKMAAGYGVSLVSEVAAVTFSKFTVIVDGIFGIGLSREVTGAPLDVIEKINAQQAARVYAIDVPSGISADKGQALGPCLKADETITFGFYKHGMEIAELQAYFGKITVADIGFFY